MVVLDTDHMSLLEWANVRDSTPLLTRLAALPPAEMVTTIISYEEQKREWMAYLARTHSMTHQVEAYRRLRRQLENYCRTPVLAFDEQAAVTLQRLRRARIRIGTMDLKIAAIALSHDAMLLSRILADFRQRPVAVEVSSISIGDRAVSKRSPPPPRRGKQSQPLEGDFRMPKCMHPARRCEPNPLASGNDRRRAWRSCGRV